MPMDVDELNLVKGKGKQGNGKDGKGMKATGKGKNEKATSQGDERRCFYCDGKGHIKFNGPQKVIDDNKEERLQERIVDRQRHACESLRERVE